MAPGTKHLSNDEFFTKLTDLFASKHGKDHGSIHTTQKRIPSQQNPSKFQILVRATNGKSKEHRKEKVKLATRVDEEEIVPFFAKYSEVCKSGMTDLKKRERKKDRNKKKKEKAKKET